MNTVDTPQSNPVTDLEHFPGFLLRRGQQAHVAAWTRKVSTKVTSIQFGVMKALRDSPGLSQRDLCEVLDLDRSTIAEIVRRLERHGYLRRERDDDDLRRNRVRLTVAGQKEVDRLQPLVYEANLEILEGLSATDRQELRRILLQLVESHRLRRDRLGSPPDNEPSEVPATA